MKTWFTLFICVLFFAIQGFAQLQFSSSSVDFGAHVITSTSTLEVVLTSQINQTITLSGLTPPFSATPETFPIVIGEQKIITLTFNPQTLDNFSQTLTATGSIWGTVQCNVYANSTNATVSFSESYLDFGNVLMTTYHQQMITVQSDINQTVTLSGLSAPFILIPTTIDLQANQPANVYISFNPHTPEYFQQDLSASGSFSGTASVSVYGSAYAASIEIFPQSCDFDPLFSGQSQTIELLVNSDINQVVNLTGLSGVFTVTPASLSLTAGDPETIHVTFSPENPGVYNQILNFQGETWGSTSISVYGECIDPAISVSPTYLNFGEVGLGSTASLTLTIYNTGNGTLNCNFIHINDHFSLSTNGLSVSQGSSNSLTVYFTPEYNPAEFDTLFIESNDPDLPLVEVPITGQGKSLISGEVCGTWYKVNSPYYFNGSVTVPENCSLTIEPGVVVNMEGYSLFVNGRLNSKGLPNDSIVFNGWGTIQTSTKYSTDTIQFVSFRHPPEYNGLTLQSYGIAYLNCNLNCTYIDNFQNSHYAYSNLELINSKINLYQVNNYSSNIDTLPSLKLNRITGKVNAGIRSHSDYGSIYLKNVELSPAGNYPLVTYGSFSRISLDSVSILNFQGNALTTSAANSQILIKNSLIKNTTGDGGRGIYTGSGNSPVFINNVIFEGLYEGILTESYPSDISITKSVIRDCSGTGIRSRRSSITIDTTFITRMGENGIYFESPSSSNIINLGNTEITACNQNGIYCEDAPSEIKISNSTISRNLQNGLSLQNYSTYIVTIENSRIQSNQNCGVYVWNHGYINVIQSEISLNNSYGINFLHYGNVTTSGSVFYKNNGLGIKSETVNALNTVVSSNTDGGIYASNIEANYLTCIYNKQRGLTCNNYNGMLYNSIVCMNNNSQTNQFYGMTDIKYSKYIGNPQLADSLGHLLSTSPCIDAADPTEQDAHIPYGLKTVHADMGAYGGPGNWIWGGSPVPEDGKPEIDQVVDLPQDQGKMVGIQYHASIFDYGNTAYTIDRYSFWRELDVNGKENIVASKEPVGLIFEKGDEYWEYVGEMPASGFEHYGFSAPTLGDSTSTGIFWSKYIVVAHSVQGNYWVSQPDSGYSADNLAPMPPANLAGSVAGASLNLNWSPVPDPDVQYYAVFRSQDDGFGSEPFTTTAETSLNGLALTAEDFRYAVAAYDFSGNKGNLSNVIISPVYDEFTVPQGWSGISSWINPLNPDLVNVVSPLGNDLMIMYNQSGMYWPGQNINTLINWNRNSGYIIKSDIEKGLPIVGSKDQNLSHYLTTNWQILPVLSECGTSTGELLNQLGDNFRLVKEIAGNRIYWPAYGIQTLNALEPGKAYFLNTITGSGSFTFPLCSMKSLIVDEVKNVDTQPVTNIKYECSPTPGSHIIVFNTSVIDILEPGDVIGVFNSSGICSGSTVIEDIQRPFAITIFEDDHSTLPVEGLLEGETLYFRVNKVNSGETYELSVTYDQSLPNTDGRFAVNGLSAVKDLKWSPISFDSEISSGINIFPNPGSGIFHLSGVSTGSRYEVLNQQGIQVCSGISGSSASIILKDQPIGVYQLKVIENGKIHILKLVLK